MTIQTVAPAQADPMQWWREARFGMFIHWGLYAVPAGEWRGRRLAGIGEWLQAEFRIPLAEYRTCARDFRPDAWDADAVARLAVDAGMRYVVITAKHHEGFAMWDSQVSDYSITRAANWHRDPLRELADACRRHDLRLGFYYSQDLDWEHPDGGGNDWDYDPAAKSLQRYLDAKVKPQLRELLTGFGPVALIWFDTPCTIDPEQAADLKRWVKSLQPDCLVSGRIGHGLGDYGNLGDNQLPAGPLSGDWETPGTLNDTWGYKRGDRCWKSTATLLGTLIDLAGKGVNYLLNIGPDAQGAIPETSVTRLREIGAWLRQNGEAIYGTSGSPWAYEFDWGRMTTRADRLYAIVTQPPAGDLVLHGLRTPVRQARLLADGSAVTVSRADAAITLRLPADRATPFAVALHLAGAPEVAAGIDPQSDGALLLPAHLATIHLSPTSAARRRRLDSNQVFAAVQAEAANTTVGDHLGIGSGGLIESWHATEDWLSWEFRLRAAGVYSVHLHSVAAKYRPWVGGHRVALRLAEQELAGDLTPDEEVEAPRTRLFQERATSLGEFVLPATGVWRLELRATWINPEDPAGLCLSRIYLRPSALSESRR